MDHAHNWLLCYDGASEQHFSVNFSMPPLLPFSIFSCLCLCREMCLFFIKKLFILNGQSSGTSPSLDAGLGL